VLRIEIRIVPQLAVPGYMELHFWNGMTNSSIRPSPLLLGKTPLGMRCFVIAINVASQSINIHVEHCTLFEHLSKNI